MVPPLEIHTDGRVAAASVFWSAQGRTFLTILAKATFAMVPDGAAEIVSPRPIEREDRQLGNHPARSVEAASDLAPWLARCDVTAIGTAHAPGGKPATAMSVRLALFRDGRALLDKALHIYGDREGDAIKPFVAMPLVYERALGGPGVAANPMGVDVRNVVDARDAGRIGCFGPIARAWPIRKRLIKDASREALSGPIAHIPDGFAWDYYQAAPPDQRVDPLMGGEWIVLDGMSPTEPRLKTQVPIVAAQIAIAAGGAEPAPRKPITLVADTLTIDADRRCFSIVWRGRHELAAAEPRDAVVAGAALGAPGSDVDWSAIFAAPASTSTVAAPSAAAPPPDAEGTMAVSEDASIRALAPFPVAAPGSGKGGHTAATPWAGSSALAARAAEVTGESTMTVRHADAGPALPFAPGSAPPALSVGPATSSPRPEVGGETIAAFGRAPDAAPSWLEAKRAPLTTGEPPEPSALSPWKAPPITGVVASTPMTIGQQYAQATAPVAVALSAETAARSTAVDEPDPPPSREAVNAVLLRAGATEEDIERMFAEADRVARKDHVDG